ncbi:MAG: 7-cyano-7-deazaguanine synthase [Bacteroidales bacterium]|nr:7-cyano-7-deazaguanine synthase [Bacteroidales bacterium]
MQKETLIRNSHIISKTYSCYKGGEKHCGKCGTCVERKEALLDAGIIDPTVYED